MKITILGAGVGSSHFPTKSQANIYPPGFLLEWGAGEKMLLECSDGIYNRIEAAGTDFTKIHHVAVSHSHADHYAFMPFYQASYLKGLWGGEEYKNMELSLYAPNFLVEQFLIFFNAQFPERNGELFEWPTLTLRGMSSGDNLYDIGTGKLTAKKVHHGWGKADALAYRLQTPEGVIAYSGDTGECEGIREIAQKADIFICECSAAIGTEVAKDYGHLAPHNVGQIAKDCGVKKVVLFHYTGLDSDENMIAAVKNAGYTGEVIAGKDSQVIQL
jgi:ribonuclease BN (tRNA processing enzyme)